MRPQFRDRPSLRPSPRSNPSFVMLDAAIPRHPSSRSSIFWARVTRTQLSLVDTAASSEVKLDWYARRLLAMLQNLGRCWLAEFPKWVSKLLNTALHCKCSLSYTHQLTRSEGELRTGEVVHPLKIGARSAMLLYAKHNSTYVTFVASWISASLPLPRLAGMSVRAEQIPALPTRCTKELVPYLPSFDENSFTGRWMST